MSAKKISIAGGAAAALLFALSAQAESPAAPKAAPSAATVQAGVYKVDPHHTQVIWSVDHLGFSTLYGAFGQPTGGLTIDPQAPQNAKVDITFALTGLTVTSEPFAKHLRSADFFDAEKFPTARFVSTSVQTEGNTADITGNLTLHGVTKPVVLKAKLHGAGPNPMTKVQTVGFSATTTLKRSDFGLGYAAPAVSDEVKLKITAAFEK